MEGPNHARRFIMLWLVASAIATPLTILLLGPILPPGKATEQASGQVTDNTLLLGMATPVLLLVVLYLLYATLYFRQPRGAVLEGPGIRGDATRGGREGTARERGGVLRRRDGEADARQDPARLNVLRTRRTVEGLSRAGRGN